ncbi:C6 zinc finger domain protein [Xylariales sp. AK1849]|nr:C6 zinc finger domain protein [Xylariales sp. AK1849]
MNESQLENPDLPGAGIAKKKRKGGPRRKTGCYTCKARHTRCDEKKPVCTNCARLKLHCQPFEFITQSAWCAPSEPSSIADTRESRSSSGASPATPTSLWDLFNVCMPDVGSEESGLPSSSSSSSVSAFPSESLNLPPRQTILFNAEIAHLMAIFQTGVATWMDVFDHSCAYQREVPRRCLTSELLMRSVCAFTAKHMSLLPGGSIWAAAAAGYYGDSLRLLIRYLNSDSPQEDALTATMLLCSYEMIAAQGHEHQRHFYGTMVLITSRGVSALSSGMDRANFWIYIRHEITVALVNEVPLQINPSLWNANWREGEVEEDALGNQLLCLVGRAIDIAYSRDPPASMSSERQAIHEQAAKWSSGLPKSFRGTQYGEPDNHGFNKIYFAVPAAATAMMWYHLLHILLYAEPTPIHPSQIYQVQYHATEIANIALSDVPQSVLSFSPQALFFAAKHISGIGKKTTLWALLDDIEVRHGFSTRSRVKQLQELVEPGFNAVIA